MPTALSSADIEHFRAALSRERDRLKDLVDRMNEAGLETAMTEAVGELSSYDQHPADAGAEMYERERDLGFRQAALATLTRIDDALERIEAGTYGVCVECGRAIARERLEALPYAERCIACSRRAEARASTGSDRPVEEEALHPPFARTFTDRSANVAYDGEDAWQDVARYGTANSPQDDLALEGDKRRRG